MSGTSNRVFLGRGLGAPLGARADGTPDTAVFDTDARGALRRADFEDSVRQSIWLILSTAKGERIMRPEFGCGIHDLVFGTIDEGAEGRVSNAVREALLRWESRIDVRAVGVAAVCRGEVLEISIDYEVRATNNVFNLVYPFYLEGQA